MVHIVLRTTSSSVVVVCTKGRKVYLLNLPPFLPSAYQVLVCLYFHWRKFQDKTFTVYRVPHDMYIFVAVMIWI